MQVLAVYRMGLWTRNITHTLFTNNWSIRTNAFTDIVSRMLHLIHAVFLFFFGNNDRFSSVSFLALHSIGYKLDVGWIKLYLEGFRSRPAKKE